MEKFVRGWRNPGKKQKKVAKQDERRCLKCKKFKPQKDYSQTNWERRDPICKKCFELIKQAPLFKKKKLKSTLNIEATQREKKKKQLQQKIKQLEEKELKKSKSKKKQEKERKKKINSLKRKRRNSQNPFSATHQNLKKKRKIQKKSLHNQTRKQQVSSSRRLKRKPETLKKKEVRSSLYHPISQKENVIKRTAKSLKSIPNNSQALKKSKTNSTSIPSSSIQNKIKVKQKKKRLIQSPMELNVKKTAAVPVFDLSILLDSDDSSSDSDDIVVESKIMMERKFIDIIEDDIEQFSDESSQEFQVQPIRLKKKKKNNTWACEKCTYKNFIDVFECEMCRNKNIHREEKISNHSNEAKQQKLKKKKPLLIEPRRPQAQKKSLINQLKRVKEERRPPSEPKQQKISFEEKKPLREEKKPSNKEKEPEEKKKPPEKNVKRKKKIPTLEDFFDVKKKKKKKLEEKKREREEDKKEIKEMKRRELLHKQKEEEKKKNMQQHESNFIQSTLKNLVMREPPKKKEELINYFKYEHQFQKYKKQFHNASKNIMNYHMHQSIGRKRTSYERANLHRFIYGNHQVLPITGKFHSMSDRQLISSIEFGPQNVLVAIASTCGALSIFNFDAILFDWFPHKKKYRERKEVLNINDLGWKYSYNKRIDAVCWDKFGQDSIFFGGIDKPVVKIQNLRKTSNIKTLRQNLNMLMPDGITNINYLNRSSLACGTKLGNVFRWDMRSKKALPPIRHKKDLSSKVLYLDSPQQNEIRTVKENGIMELWDIRSRQRPLKEITMVNNTQRIENVHYHEGRDCWVVVYDFKNIAYVDGSQIEKLKKNNYKSSFKALRKFEIPLQEVNPGIKKSCLFENDHLIAVPNGPSVSIVDISSKIEYVERIRTYNGLRSNEGLPLCSFSTPANCKYTLEKLLKLPNIYSSVKEVSLPLQTTIVRNHPQLPYLIYGARGSIFGILGWERENYNT